MLDERDIPATAINYLEQPPAADMLKRIIAGLDVPAHALLRSGDPTYHEAGLRPDSDQPAIVEALVRHPALLQRPIVLVGDRARIGRPPERIEEILP